MTLNTPLCQGRRCLLHCDNRASIEMGGPDNLMTCVQRPTIQSAQTLMITQTNLVVVTGGGAVVRAAMQVAEVCRSGPGIHQ